MLFGEPRVLQTLEFGVELLVDFIFFFLRLIEQSYFNTFWVCVGMVLLL